MIEETNPLFPATMELGVLPQHPGSVTAKWNDSEVVLASEIESGKHKPFGDSPATKLRGNLSMREDHAISFDAIFGKGRPSAEGDLKAVFGFVVHNEIGFRLAFHHDERLPHPLEKYSAKN